MAGAGGERPGRRTSGPGARAVQPGLLHGPAVRRKGDEGFLYARGAEDVWGHSLADLCEDAKIFEMLFDVLKVRAIYLDKYYNLTRYPNYLPGGIPADVFDDLETERALELANEVLTFVRERLAEE